MLCLLLVITGVWLTMLLGMPPGLDKLLFLGKVFVKLSGLTEDFSLGLVGFFLQ